LEHDGRGSNAEKVKFSTFKDAGHSAGQTPIEVILWTWETEFASDGLSPNVSRVISLILPGGNLSSWKDTFGSVNRDLNDPENIRNWTWERFGKELYKLSMYRDPNKKKLLVALRDVKCKDPGHSDQITTYDNAFMLALQHLRLYHLDSTFSAAQQAQMYYDNLTPLIRKHMALRDGKRADPEIRDDLDDIMYDDNDSEEMSEREFAYYSLPPKAQAHAHIARLGGDYCVKECTSCNCAEGHCYHPWSNDTPHFNP
jgi:hypothetical protein